ncbi:YjfI family protein [Xanthomonas sp. WG16]|nr:YjfI family protein [Xanthomonas sp. WG16]QOX01835.1 YjfI family protein [Xanthomonas sp. WG16]QXF00829.1 YjfI family protein [Xanthomonas citri pv. citri]
MLACRAPDQLTFGPFCRSRAVCSMSGRCRTFAAPPPRHDQRTGHRMTQYTTVELHGLLAERYRGQPIHVELIDGMEPAINLTLADHGDMQIQVAASGSQVFVSTLLAHAEHVNDRAAFNDACLRLNPLNPLSNLGLVQVDGKDRYVVFGELSAPSTLDQIDEEIQTLAANTLDAAESLKPFFS